MAILQTSIAAVLIRNALSAARPINKAAQSSKRGNITSNPIGDSRCTHVEIEGGSSDSSMDRMEKLAYGDNKEGENAERENKRFIPDILKVRRTFVW